MQNQQRNSSHSLSARIKKSVIQCPSSPSLITNEHKFLFCCLHTHIRLSLFTAQRENHALLCTFCSHSERKAKRWKFSWRLSEMMRGVTRECAYNHLIIAQESVNWKTRQEKWNGLRFSNSARYTNEFQKLLTKQATCTIKHLEV